MKCESCGAFTKINHAHGDVVLCAACARPVNEHSSNADPAYVSADPLIYGVLSAILFIAFSLVWYEYTFIASLIPLVASFVFFSIYSSKKQNEDSQNRLQKIRDEGYRGKEGAKNLAKSGRMDDAITLYSDVENIPLEADAKDGLGHEITFDIYNNTIDSLITQHHKALLRNKKRLISKDDYGVVDDSAWHVELEKFAENVALPMLDQQGYFTEDFKPSTDEELESVEYESFMRENIKDGIVNDINKRLTNYTANSNTEFHESMSPEEFEYFCSEILDKAGWNTTLTAAPGDQGIDIVAEIEAITIVVQCKKYASPIGNKAVQEAIAGKAYIGADGAVVVTNSSYTKSAKELARTSDVKLLHYEELGSLTAYDF